MVVIFLSNRALYIFRFLINPVVLGLLISENLHLVEQQSNLFLRALNGIGAAADVAADILRHILAAC